MKKKTVIMSVTILSSVLVLVIFLSILTAGVPDDNPFMHCLQACTNDCTACIQGCDILDDSCWDYCFQLLTICVSGCPGMGRAFDALR